MDKMQKDGKSPGQILVALRARLDVGVLVALVLGRRQCTIFCQGRLIDAAP